MSKEAISEQSLVHEGAGYNKVFQIGQEPKEGHSWSSKRETLARSPDEDEDYIGEEDKKEIYKGEVDGEGEIDSEVEIKDDMDDRTPEVGSSVNLESGHVRPFILPQMWTVNDFLPKMTSKIFKNLRHHFQIPNHITIRLSGNFENCYSRETEDTGMYDATLATGLRLPLTMLTISWLTFLVYPSARLPLMLGGSL